MKVRSGFVSNSSSSSFIVAFPQVPGSVDEVRALLFGDVELWAAEWYEHDSIEISILAKRVFSQIEEGQPVAVADIVYEASSGTLDSGEADRVTYDMFRSDGGDINGVDWRAYEREKRKMALGFAEDFVEANEGCTFLRFSFSDDDPVGATLERSEVFRNLAHFRVSHH